MNLESGANPPFPEIDVSVQDPAWEKIDKISNLVHKVASTTLTAAIIPRFAFGRALEVSIVLANDDLIQLLNREYRNKDAPTNVLSFATLDSEEPETGDVLNLGDVILSYQTIMREAEEQNKTITEHTMHLIVHGVLHVLGYNHQTDDSATDMETLEIRILERLGVQNPYTELDPNL